MNAIAAVQFGFAIRPRCCRISSPLISGITRGTSCSIRKTDELSITTAPATRASGTYFREISPPALKNAMSILSNEFFPNSSTTIDSPRKRTDLPAERDELNACKLATGKLRRSKTRTSSSPTAPVAPTTAILYSFIQLANFTAALNLCKVSQTKKLRRGIGILPMRLHGLEARATFTSPFAGNGSRSGADGRHCALIRSQVRVSVSARKKGA